MNVDKIRKGFAIYENVENLHYLDTAASALKLKKAVERVDYYNNFLGVNVHRGVYQLSYDATKLYEDAREVVANFINTEARNIVFTRGTTTSLNNIATMLKKTLKKGDEVITTEVEHHSSILPWMAICKEIGAKLIFIPLTKEGKITAENFEKVLTNKTRIVAITHMSNVLGYLTPIKEITKLAHEKNTLVILDAAQSAVHTKIDVKDIDVDFLAFSGHKLMGPTGIGVFYGKEELLSKLEPFEYGGEMANQVFNDDMTFKDAPYKFEAGTPIIGGAIGLAEAINYIEKLGFDDIEKHTKKLFVYTVSKLQEIKEVIIYNENAEGPILTFNIKDIHPHDAASIFDKNGVCIRAGHHCAQLVTKFLKVNSTLRASFYIYNDINDCDKLIESIRETIEFFK